MGKPLGMFLLLKFFIQLSEDDCHIPDNAVIYDNIFIDFYRININLQKHTEWLSHIADYQKMYPMTIPKEGLSGPFMIAKIYELSLIHIYHR